MGAGTAGEDLPHVVIVGGGFGGLQVARDLRRAPVRITLIDRQNFHLFQPLLYQVATGGLAGADITSPLRRALKRQRNTTVLLGEVNDVDPEARTISVDGQPLRYDAAVIATGVVPDYFGHPEWESRAPGLKALADAHELRHRVLDAFERAEAEPDPEERARLLTFVVIGGGSTGVELAGAIGELAHRTLPGEFRRIDPRSSRIVLVEAGPAVLPGFSPPSRRRATRALERLGVEVQAGTRVADITAHGVTLDRDGASTLLPTATVAWAAGITGSGLGATVAARTRCQRDDRGRLRVEPDLSVAGFTDLFVIGDLAHVEVRGAAIPCVAPAAIQQGRHVARILRNRFTGIARGHRPFQYRDKGMLATIGRAAAVAEYRGFRVWGVPAWIAWVVIHLIYLVEFQNRILVMTQWVSQYLFSGRGARVLTAPPVRDPEG
ncbi:MAG TPA: NAD(P)/FAD-dependent oxidoreductase [Gemmatimonadales bacterium]|nr:NAD(P)/FAD-dependent oxidoreductase [Gemmatimonadales bacterium]HRX18219.1 NAD(P)/FAD-dependent oxidoreductase [Gemmatimonadales bacterium]